MASTAAGQPLFMGLGDLDGGVQDSRALGVSADGSAVVGVGSSGENFPQTEHDEAFRWTEETGIAGLGDLPGIRLESWALLVAASLADGLGRGQ